MKIEFKKGRKRMVLLFSTFGVVIKIPVVHFASAIDRFWHHRRQIYFESYAEILFGGIVENWMEFLFFLKTRNPFLQPTYFSFFGLFNIQKFGEPHVLAEDQEASWYFQLHLLSRMMVSSDGHHFSNSENFTLVNNKLRILDYGSKTTQKIVTIFGKKIFESFDPNFKFEEYKKARAAKKV